jgi:trypsin
VIVTGWGVTDDGSIPVMLQKVDKAIMPINECRGYWGDVPYGMFCTVVENGRDSCNGDSGSPVIRNGVQIGLVSYGSEVCGDGSAPAVYVRLEEPGIRNWIASFVTL